MESEEPSQGETLEEGEQSSETKAMEEKTEEELIQEGYVRERVQELELKGSKDTKGTATEGAPKADPIVTKYGVTLRTELPEKFEDENGHLFVPVEGMLAKESEARMTSGLLKPRFFVLTPQFLGYFHKKEQAQIDERGFMHGRCSLEKLKKMSKDGAYIKLKHILTIKSNRESPHIYLEFQNGASMHFVGESPEAARLWVASINEWRNRAVLKNNDGDEADGRPGAPSKKRASFLDRFRPNKKEHEQKDGDEGDTEEGNKAEEEGTITEKESNQSAPKRKSSVFHRLFGKDGKQKNDDDYIEEDQEEEVEKGDERVGEDDDDEKKDEDGDDDEGKGQDNTAPQRKRSMWEDIWSGSKRLGMTLMQDIEEMKEHEVKAKEQRDRSFEVFEYQSPIQPSLGSGRDDVLVALEKDSRGKVKLPGQPLVDSTPAERQSRDYKDGAVLHGWLTKVEHHLLSTTTKDRYFILTPTYLCYFLNTTDASVSDRSIVTGKLSKSKTDINRLTHTGAKIPLESISDVNIVQREEVKEITADDEEDEDESATAESNKDSTGGEKKWVTSKIETNKFELDIGDNHIITIDAHNQHTRDVWVESIRGWCAIRKSLISDGSFGDLSSVAQFRMFQPGSEQTAGRGKRKSATPNNKAFGGSAR